MGYLDLADNALIVDYIGESPIAANDAAERIMVRAAFHIIRAAAIDVRAGRMRVPAGYSAVSCDLVADQLELIAEREPGCAR